MKLQLHKNLNSMMTFHFFLEEIFIMKDVTGPHIHWCVGKELYQHDWYISISVRVPLEKKISK